MIDCLKKTNFDFLFFFFLIFFFILFLKFYLRAIKFDWQNREQLKFIYRMQLRFFFFARNITSTCIVFHSFPFQAIPFFHSEKINIRIKSKTVVYDLFNLPRVFGLFFSPIVKILSCLARSFQKRNNQAKKSEI